jgi:hypothetical protein
MTISQTRKLESIKKIHKENIINVSQNTKGDMLVDVKIDGIIITKRVGKRGHVYK